MKHHASMRAHLYYIELGSPDPEALSHLTNHEIIEKAGSQGVELMTWIAMRAAMTGSVKEVHATYHVPISNTGGAVMLFENQSQPQAMAAE